MQHSDGLCIYKIFSVSWHYLAFLLLSTICFENATRAHDQMRTGARCAFVPAVYLRILPVFTGMQILQVWLCTCSLGFAPTGALVLYYHHPSPPWLDLNSWHPCLFKTADERWHSSVKMCKRENMHRRPHPSPPSPHLPWPALLPRLASARPLHCCQCTCVMVGLRLRLSWRVYSSPHPQAKVEVEA